MKEVRCKEYHTSWRECKFGVVLLEVIELRVYLYLISDVFARTPSPEELLQSIIAFDSSSGRPASQSDVVLFWDSFTCSCIFICFCCYTLFFLDHFALKL